MGKRLLGLDIGTTGCKAAIFDEDGTLLKRAMREYAVDFPHPNWAEQDAERVWALAQDAMRQVIAEAGEAQPVAIGLSCQGEAVMPVDKQGKALRPAILGMDSRTTAENEQLRSRFGAWELFQQTGMPCHTVNTLPKLMWLRAHEPQWWTQAARFLLYEDFLIQRMTGRAVISRCLASRTQMFDVKADRWAPQLLAAADLSPQQLAQVQPSGHAVGTMSPDLARSLGLRQPPVVATGGHDQACGALGCGTTRAGIAMVSSGTAEVLELASTQPALSEGLFQSNISCYAHAVDGLWVSMTLNHSGGLLLRWLRDTLCQDLVKPAAQRGADAYDLMFQGCSPDPSPVMVLPHFAGAGTPSFDTASRGAFIGMTFATTRADLAKACLDGLSFELRMNTDILKAAAGGTIRELRAIGGGARSALWLQLKADITGIPVVVPAVTDAACWGAAMLGGKAAGLFPDLGAAAAERCRLTRRFDPDPKRQKAYDDRYQLYRQIHGALAPIHHRM